MNRGAVNYGSNVSSFDNSDWSRYNAVDFGSGANQITIAVGIANSGGYCQLDRPQLVVA